MFRVYTSFTVALVVALLLIADIVNCNEQRPNKGRKSHQATALGSPTVNGSPQPTNSQTPDYAANSFAVDFYNKVARSHQGNLVFSPLSVYASNLLLYFGAKEDTKKLLEPLLHLKQLYAWNYNEDEIAQLFGNIFQQPAFKRKKGTANSQEVRLTLVNALFNDIHVDVNSEYQKRITSALKARIYNETFATNPAAARVRINKWVSDMTDKMISDLLPVGSLDGAVLLLLNAIYFKGGWEKPFEPAETVKGEFRGLNHMWSQNVDYMKTTQTFNYFATGQFEAVEIPYSQKEASMIVVLPKSNDQFNRLDANHLLSLFKKDSSSYRLVALKLPKFRSESQLDLRQTFNTMGLSFLFDDNVDLSGISNSENVRLSKAFHKAVINIHENGTEFAAASAALPVPVSMPDQSAPVEFFVNRPFLYFIRHNPTNLWLLMGKVQDFI